MVGIIIERGNIKGKVGLRGIREVCVEFSFRNIEFEMLVGDFELVEG